MGSTFERAVRIVAGSIVMGAVSIGGGAVAMGGAGCATSDASTTPAADGGTADVGIVAPPSNACDGDTTTCIRGSVTTKVFTGPYISARVFLFAVFPSGAAQAIGASATSDGGNEVATDGTFAFSHVPAGGHYYLRALARFDAADPKATIESIVGPVAIPSTSPITITIRPVMLSVLQGRASGDVGPATLTWAVARVFDPSNGHEVTDAVVTFNSGTESWPLGNYGKNATGTDSYFLALPANTPGNTAFSFDTNHTSTGKLTWNLTAELPNFDGTINSPADGAHIALGQPFDVAWTQAPGATYTLLQLFHFDSGQYTATYQSPAPLAPEVTGDTIPAANVTLPGTYRLAVVFSKTTCPPEADGCAYNTSTAGATLNAN